MCDSIYAVLCVDQWVCCMEFLTADTEGALTADGLDDALVGFGHQFNRPVAVYSKMKCLGILQSEHGMSIDDALEYFQFNIAGAWLRDGMPVFLDDEPIAPRKLIDIFGG